MSLEKTVGLRGNEDDIQDLVEEHRQELYTNELMDQHCEQQQEVMEATLSEEEKKMEDSLTLNEIREMCKTCDKGKHFVEKYHK